MDIEVPLYELPGQPRRRRADRVHQHRDSGGGAGQRAVGAINLAAIGESALRSPRVVQVYEDAVSTVGGDVPDVPPQLPGLFQLGLVVGTTEIPPNAEPLGQPSPPSLRSLPGSIPEVAKRFDGPRE